MNLLALMLNRCVDLRSSPRPHLETFAILMYTVDVRFNPVNCVQELLSELHSLSLQILLLCIDLRHYKRYGLVLFNLLIFSSPNYHLSWSTILFLFCL